MEQTLLSLLKEIAMHPEDISVEKEEVSLGVVYFHIHAHDEDKGVIIGKSGRTIKALQNIIAIKAVKENKRVTLAIE